MTENDIIDIWRSVGIHGLDDYSRMCKTEEGVKALMSLEDKFDPDLIDPKVFWKASDIHFTTDPVANSTTPSISSFEYTGAMKIAEANKNNHCIPLFSGMMGQFEHAKYNILHKFGQLKVAEIGCGYGSLYECHIQPNEKDCIYTGFDIIPRTPYAVELHGDGGSFSEDQIKEYKDKYNLFYSCNVFQHLSKKQITTYIKQVHEMLPTGAYALLSNASSSNLLLNSLYSESKSFHYGQVVHLFSYAAFLIELDKNGFHIISSCMNHAPNKLNVYSILAERI